MDSFDMVLSVGALIIGIMILTGHGQVFMKGGNEEVRKKMYDEKKMEKVSGISLIAIGVATGISAFTTGVTAKVIYTVVLVGILAAMLYFLRKCKK